MARHSDGRPGGRVRTPWQRIAHAVSWTRPTSTEIGVVVKSGLAAGLAWWIALTVTGVSDPVLASLTAIVVVQVSVRASVRTAFQRSGAVVLGVLPRAGHWRRAPVERFHRGGRGRRDARRHTTRAAASSLVGAAVGVAISLLLPASRLVDARHTLERLVSNLSDVLESMADGLQQPWSTEQTGEWRRTARMVRARLVDEAEEAIGNSREVARWNVRDRRLAADIHRYEEVMPRLERAAIGVSVISRGLDDHAHVYGTTHRAMPAMGARLLSLAAAIRAIGADLLGDVHDDSVARSLAEVHARRDRCAQDASRRARLALEDHESADHELEVEWLGYAALLVQVDRIVGDLSAPLPT